MRIQIISLFPEVFEPILGSSMLFKATKNDLVKFEHINLRDFGLGPRRTVDDTPYGGGDGMLLKPEPLVAAIEKAKEADPEAIVILPTPRGKTYKQSDAKELALSSGLIIVCAHYEGYDERITNWVDKQYSVGSYILTGGEIPAMLLIDSVVRLIPGVLGGEASAEKESFQADDQTIEHPHYTRPEVFRGLEVPKVLLSGHHQEIEKWRADKSKP
ncbi:MAG TPA: tRNA (guanosine(37)-N1)-methyltransferase TrmD [Candidatus Saccharimonadales bacterium]|jgi:tRNA (guanine37-N1)-methyltransferase